MLVLIVHMNSHDSSLNLKQGGPYTREKPKEPPQDAVFCLTSNEENYTPKKLRLTKKSYDNHKPKLALIRLTVKGSQNNNCLVCSLYSTS